MRDNIKFFVKLCAFFLLILGIVAGVIIPQYATDYTAALIDKYERLASVAEPKIILVGDSNVAFGFDSEMIEEAFQMPVVNFGLHGGLGVAFHSDMIKDHISEGDIVIIAPFGYSDGLELGNPLLAWMAVENHVYLLKNMPRQDAIEMAKAFPTYLKRSLNRWIYQEGNLPVLEEHPYKRSAFNERGDNIQARPQCIMDEENYGGYFTSMNLAPHIQKYWNDYATYVESRGAKLYMSCPPILKEALYSDSDRILENLQMQLETELSFPMISKLKDYIYPLEYFYNTGFHLNDTGRVVRTKQLICDLTPYLP